MINIKKIPVRDWSALSGKNKKSGLPAQAGFIKLIIIIIIALLIMRYFGLTFSGILGYLGITWAEIISWFKTALDWLKDLFISVK